MQMTVVEWGEASSLWHVCAGPQVHSPDKGRAESTLGILFDFRSAERTCAWSRADKGWSCFPCFPVFQIKTQQRPWWQQGLLRTCSTNNICVLISHFLKWSRWCTCVYTKPKRPCIHQCQVGVFVFALTWKAMYTSMSGDECVNGLHIGPCLSI